MKRFRRNPHAERELRAARDFKDGRMAAAREVKRQAERLAPRGDTGRTARSFEVVEEGDDVRVINTDAFFHLTEFGSIHNPPYAPLRRGVKAAGLHLKEDPK